MVVPRAPLLPLVVREDESKEVPRAALRRDEEEEENVCCGDKLLDVSKMLWVVAFSGLSKKRDRTRSKGLVLVASCCWGGVLVLPELVL